MNGEIEKNRWSEYLNEFSRRNEFRPARVEIFGEEIGAQEGGEHLPLAGVSFEIKGSEAGDVVVTFAGPTAADSRHLTHRVNAVKRIVPMTGENESEEGLEIESADGERTILVFERLPGLPPITS
jgi:hypothetical protein